MADSQRSFETLKGRYVNGNEYIQGISGYDPQENILIKKASQAPFLASVDSADNTVVLALDAYMSEVAGRKPLVFRQKNCDINCLENRIRNIHSFIGADIGKSCGAYKIIGGFIKNFAPHYKKKDPNAPPDVRKLRSPSEKSFVAMNGYGLLVHQLIVELGTAYTPQNTNILPAEFLIFVKDLLDRTKKVAKYESDYLDAANGRKPFYYGPEGILERERLIKGYLASFSGGKKSQNYIEYDRLIKGK